MLRKFGLENWWDENHAIFTNDFVNLNLSPQKIERRVKLKFGLIDVSHGMCEFHKWQFQQKPKY